MKKVLLMGINMNVGGTEKALLSMISEMPRDKFEIDILMLEKYGDFLNELPKDVNIKYLDYYTDIKDILDVYNIKFTKRKTKNKEIYLDIPEELIEVYKIINQNPKSINEIALETGLSISEINYKTMMLEIEGKILELPGQRFIRKEEE